MSKQTIEIPLKTWSWRMSNSNGDAVADSKPELKDWTPSTASPSVIHMELLARNLIPDPNIGENERLMQWAGNVDWEYRAIFPTPESVAQTRELDLVFEGLDTHATVWLNGAEILKSTNMFIPARIPVKSALAPEGEENTLLIAFESAAKIGAAFNERYGKRWSRMRDSKRNYIRKAQVGRNDCVLFRQLGTS
jgi:beta-mannosidase